MGSYSLIDSAYARGKRPLPPLELSSVVAERYRPMVEMYRLLTGFPEANPAALWHHRITDHRSPWPKCGTPLRTVRARYYVACGYGMDEMQRDPRPLIERRPEEFSGEAS